MLKQLTHILLLIDLGGTCRFPRFPSGRSGRTSRDHDTIKSHLGSARGGLVALSAWLSGVDVGAQYLDVSDRGGICGRIRLALSRWLGQRLWLLFDGLATATCK